MGLNWGSKKKPELYNFEQEEKNDEDRKSRERLDREEQKLDKKQKKIDEQIQQAEEARNEQLAQRLEIEDQRRRFEEEEARRKAKKEADAIAANAPQPPAAVTLKPDTDIPNPAVSEQPEGKTPSGERVSVSVPPSPDA